MKQKIMCGMVMLAVLAVLAVGWGGEGNAEAAPITTVGTFSGGDAGEGLDMQGTFDYAIDFRGPGGVAVGDATFTNDSVAGLTLFAEHEILVWHIANYGATANDSALEAVMRDIRFSFAPDAVAIALNVKSGSEYKLQLLFAESGFNRGFDVFLEGVIEVDNFNPRGGTRR